MNTARAIILAATLTLTAAQAGGQRHEIYNDRIASLQVTAGDDWLSPPVATLHGGEPINISFDDMTHEYHRYTYEVVHCEADWTPSKEIFSSDYVEGFPSGNTIDDLQESDNTNTLYTHYRLTLPNARCRLKLSGNYRVNVYDDDNGQEPMLTACFMLVNPQADVQLAVTTQTDLDINGRHQQLSMQVNYGTLRVTDPARQVKTVIMQNGRWDNAVVNPKPQYVMHDGLRWDHNRQLIFDGGNEYRKFESLDVTHTTMGLESVGWDGNDYHAYVWPDEPRPNYVYDEDANGAFYIRNSDNVDNDVASDYLYTHFTLKAPRQDADVYLNAAWTRDQFQPQYLMAWNADKQCYEAVVFLKQGYYSYQYLMLRADGSTAPVPAEGDFFQTENKYQALVYYRSPTGRTDQLVGYQQVQYK